MESLTSKQASTQLNVFVNHKGIELEELYGKALAILGVRGSGKTNTAAVLVEELLTSGVPVIVLDIDGEYWTLRESYDVLIVSDETDSDIPLNISDPTQAERLARALLQTHVPAVLDFSAYTVGELSDYLKNFLEELWKSSRQYRRPLFLVVEEAHEFIPQGMTNPVKNFLVRIALRGRKRGLGLIMVSQRSAKVDKDVLSQAEYYVLHKVVHPADLKVYKDLLPLKPKEVETTAPKLGVGEALFYDSMTVTRVKVRKRKTYHIGYTPKTPSKTSFTLRAIDRKILEQVLSIIGTPSNQPLSTQTTTTPTEQADKQSPPSLTEQGTHLQATLETIVKLVTILSRMTPSTTTHMHTLAREGKWLTYKQLRQLSNLKTINTNDFKRLKRLKIIKVEKNGRETIVKQNFLTNNPQANNIIIQALNILQKEKTKKTNQAKQKKRKNRNPR